MTDQPWLKVADVAERAGVSRDTIYTAVELGEIRHVRVGGRRALRFKADWVDAWLERFATGGATAPPGDRDARVRRTG
jgi:excisionase family DNA binding protein